MNDPKKLQFQCLEGRRLFAADAMSLQMIPNVGTGRYDFVAPAEVSTVHSVTATQPVSLTTHDADLFFGSADELFGPNQCQGGYIGSIAQWVDAGCPND